MGKGATDMIVVFFEAVFGVNCVLRLDEMAGVKVMRGDREDKITNINDDCYYHPRNLYAQVVYCNRVYKILNE